MCNECGCGLNSGHGHESHAHEHHDSAHHPHLHSHGHPLPHLTLSISRSLMEKNQLGAERNRALFRSRQLLVLNVASSPGSGKTTLIRETVAGLQGRLRAAVIVGDLATENDAERLRSAGVPVVQITTGTVCHLDSEMVFKAATQLDLSSIELLVIENVGNLVCPADYDLGEDLRVVLLSTTEGEDKPLKYPPMFHSADIVVVTKCDLASATEFNRELALRNLRQISHHARILEVSAKTGAGMDAWLQFLVDRRSSASAASH